MSLIEEAPGQDWRDLQTRVQMILQECGFEAESPRDVDTVRGRVEVDVYAVDPSATPRSLYLCECKRWDTNVPQSEVLAFRTVVADAGANHGLFISSRGFQRGAYAVVRGTNVSLLSWTDFQALFVERWCRQYWAPTFRRHGGRLASRSEMPRSDAWLVFEHGGRGLTTEEVVGMMANSMWGRPFLALPDAPAAREPLATAIWRLRDKYRAHLPPEVLEITHLRPLLTYLVSVAAHAERDV